MINRRILDVPACFAHPPQRPQGARRDTGALSRLLSCPSGAESTGLQAVDDLNGFSYIMSNFQHPGDWESPLHDVVKPVLDPLEKANYKGRYSAAVGYLALAGRVRDR